MFPRPAQVDGRRLYAFRHEIEAAAKRAPDLVEQACLLWNCITVRILALASQPGGTLVHYEDLNASPETEFPKLYERLGLTWSTRSLAFIERHRGVNLNLKDAKRFSLRQGPAIDAAGQHLSTSEVKIVKDATSQVAAVAYGV